MTTTNETRAEAKHAWLWLLAVLVCGCSSTHKPDDASSGSHWLTCTADKDCSSKVQATHCGAAGICLDAHGARVSDPSHGSNTDAGPASGGKSGGAGSGRAGGGASGNGTGTGGKSTGTGGKGSAGVGTGSGGSGGSGAGGSGGGSAKDAGIITGADAGVGFALPDCGSFNASEGSDCHALSNQPVPECCSASSHLRCEYAGCTNGIPGSCTGTFKRVVGSTACGGYQPCAGKSCGDACTLCEPGDPACSETAVLKACNATGVCMAGTPDCTPPASCDPGNVHSCGSGQACCAVGRCGPVLSDQGRCEDADPATGGCKRCACESQPGGCPICNSPDTPIATPEGERAIAELREGDLVLSMDHGRLVAVPVVATRSVAVFNHAVVHLVLDNGRTLEISGSHPTADGRRLDALAPGDTLGGPHVQSIEFVPYAHDRTYDILPASSTGTYVAGGALIGSTLFAR